MSCNTITVLKMSKAFNHACLRCRRTGITPYSQTYARSRRFVHASKGLIHVSDEVREAIDDKRPVVALESTIYTHGSKLNPTFSCNGC